jgi:hypothetical protein
MSKTDKKLIKPILEASYQPKKLASKTLAKSGYTLDKKLSTNESKVFVDEQGNPNIAFRGSTNAKDFLFSDPLLSIGASKYDPRFIQAKQLTKQVEKKYGKPADVFGHSLGGSLAEASGAKGNIITYNKGVGVAGIGKTIPKNQTDIRTKADIVSVLSLTQKHDDGDLINLKTPIIQNPIKAHGLEHLNKISETSFV